MHRIAIIRGDGVGPEISDAAVRVIEATGVECKWETALVGREAEREFASRFRVNL
jgi:isocitrate dehydrogenase (NAD+)